MHEQRLGINPLNHEYQFHWSTKSCFSEISLDRPIFEIFFRDSVNRPLEGTNRKDKRTKQKRTRKIRSQSHKPRSSNIHLISLVSCWWAGITIFERKKIRNKQKRPLLHSGQASPRNSELGIGDEWTAGRMDKQTDRLTDKARFMESHARDSKGMKEKEEQTNALLHFPVD